MSRFLVCLVIIGNTKKTKMKTLLRIDCSARIEGSHSRKMADFFEQKWRENNRDGQVVYRDLAKMNLPHIQNKTIEGFYTPAEYMTSETLEATALSDSLITELKQADEILLSTPLYNLNIPSPLKAYLDQIIRVGHTFNFSEDGNTGLLENKTAYIITSKGGVYKNTPMEKFDFQEPYLNAVLNYIGIRVNEIFSLEGTSDEQVLTQNKEHLEIEIQTIFNN